MTEFNNHYKQDMTFGILQNEGGEREFAVQLVRDAKGKMWTPDKRPVF